MRPRCWRLADRGGRAHRGGRTAEEVLLRGQQAQGVRLHQQRPSHRGGRLPPGGPPRPCHYPPPPPPSLPPRPLASHRTACIA